MDGEKSKLRELCGDLEDMSVFKDAVSLLEVRTRLEPAVDEAERALTAARSEAERYKVAIRDFLLRYDKRKPHLDWSAELVVLRVLAQEEDR